MRINYFLAQVYRVSFHLATFGSTARLYLAQSRTAVSFPGFGHVRKMGDSYRWIPIPYTARVTELDPKS